MVNRNTAETITSGAVTLVDRLRVERLPVHTGYRSIPVTGETITGRYRLPVERLPVDTSDRILSTVLGTFRTLYLKILSTSTCTLYFTVVLCTCT